VVPLVVERHAGTLADAPGRQVQKDRKSASRRRHSRPGGGLVASRRMKQAVAMLIGCLAAPIAQAGPAPDVTMTWVEKYLTYRQDHEDRLTLTDAHFLAEIIFDGERDWDAVRAEIRKPGAQAPLASYGGS